MINLSKENTDVYDEDKRQRKIEKAHNEYVEVDSIDTYVLECNKIEPTERYNPDFNKEVNVEIQDETFISRLVGYTDFDDRDESYYVIIRFLHFAGFEYVIMPEVFVNKEKAKSRAKNTCYKVHFKFINNNYIRYKPFKQTKVLGNNKILSKDRENYELINISRDFIQDDILIYKNIEDDRCNIETEKNNQEESYQEPEYKSVTAKVELSGDTMNVKTEKQNIEWTFKRTNSGLFCDIARDIIENSTENGLCVFTIVNKGEKDANSQSICGKWWIKGF